MLELAVRNYNGGSELIAGQNKSELSKLSRVPASKAQTRVLLLIDLGSSYLQESKLYGKGTINII